MKTNEAKKFEQVKIRKLKQEYLGLAKRISMVERAFTTVECRHRKGDLCTHGRHTMKKYPGHKPVVPLCVVPVCPL